MLYNIYYFHHLITKFEKIKNIESNLFKLSIIFLFLEDMERLLTVLEKLFPKKLAESWYDNNLI